MPFPGSIRKDGDRMKIKAFCVFAIAYLIFINCFTYCKYRDDKRKAIKGKWRISERELLLLAAAGGSIGALVSMKRHHHKTKKKKFSIGIPAIIIAQLAAAAFICLKNLL